jgi:hypothetical protein
MQWLIQKLKGYGANYWGLTALYSRNGDTLLDMMAYAKQ